MTLQTEIMADENSALPKIVILISNNNSKYYYFSLIDPKPLNCTVILYYQHNNLSEKLKIYIHFCTLFALMTKAEMDSTSYFFFFLYKIVMLEEMSNTWHSF